MKIQFIEVSLRTGIIIGLTILLAGLLLTGWKFNQIVTEIDSRGWNEVSGTLEKSNYYTTREKMANSSGASITYHGDFTIEGREFVGNQSMRTGIGGKMDQFKKRIEEKPTVTVYVNPENRSQSVIYNGISDDSSVRMAASSFLIPIGLMILYFQWRRYKAGQA
jgi:hypothetical protein